MNWAISFFQQHKSKVYWAAGLSAGAYALSEYLKSRLLSLQSEFLATHSKQTNIIRRFEQNQQDSIFTVLSFLPEISTSVHSELNAELITHLLQNKNDTNVVPTTISMDPTTIETLSRMTKQELWEELKIVTITRLITSAYTLILLTLFTRLQLNTIGRYIYIDSLLYDNPQPVPSILESDVDSEKYLSSLPSSIEQMYLTFSWYFLQEGWKELAKKVNDAVKAVFGGVSLKSEVTPTLIMEWMDQVRKLVESEMDSDSFLTLILMPPEEKEYEILRSGGIVIDGQGKIEDSFLRNIIDETKDVLESPHFHQTFLECSAAIFNLILSQFDPCFQNQSQAKLASLLPISKQLPQSILNGSPNDFNLSLAENLSLRNFSILIYTQHSNVCGC
ncbi:peroxin [Coelomomyces lativittatus]|nr:peroxin [Coelomomyces lativittatus]KAJ1513742.1 peroxin [Coelomomyces lativittatus]